MDRDHLAQVHEVDELDLSDRSRIATLPSRLLRADLVFCWFASLHSLIPSLGASLTRKPLIVVAGGYDAANIPEIGFGHMGHPWKQHVVKSICRQASMIVTHSHYAAEAIRLNIHPRAPVRVVYLGVPMPAGGSGEERDRLALSVGLVRRENLLRKGHEVFVRAAVLVPEARFVLAGRWVDDTAEFLREIAPSNVEIRDHLPDQELVSLYRRASVYVQASAHESFGLAVAEAMAYGDVPVVSRRGALPEVVGADGVYVDESSVESVAAGIREALAIPQVRRDKLASRVREMFPPSGRRDGLLEAVEWVTRKQGHHGATVEPSCSE